MACAWDSAVVTITSDTISIRLATPGDAVALARLAALDSAAVPPGPVLLAERDGALQAALALDGQRTTIADPFAPTAELVALLRVRAARLSDFGRPRSRAIRWRALLRRPSPPTLAAGSTGTTESGSYGSAAGR
jgi:hypothetical protein